MRNLFADRRIVALLATTTLAACAVASALAQPAGAEVWGGTLPGKTWQTDGVVFNVGNIFGTDHGTEAICVGPVQWTGKWTFPYGWNCAARSLTWSFTQINAAGAVDNPNSKSFSYEASDWE